MLKEKKALLLNHHRIKITNYLARAFNEFADLSRAVILSAVNPYTLFIIGKQVHQIMQTRSSG